MLSEELGLDLCTEGIIRSVYGSVDITLPYLVITTVSQGSTYYSTLCALYISYPNAPNDELTAVGHYHHLDIRKDLR
jgi:hypothetical protein